MTKNEKAALALLKTGGRYRVKQEEGFDIQPSFRWPTFDEFEEDAILHEEREERLKRDKND